MRVRFASISAFVLFAAAMSLAPAAMAQFSTPFALTNSGASMGGVVHPAAGPQALALWNTNSQFSYASQTAGTWSAPIQIQNAFSSASCCSVLHADGAGNATLVFSTGGGGTFTADYTGGEWTTVQQLPSSPPFFPNGFGAFVENANGDAAVIGTGGDFRAVRRTAGGAWGAAETIPMPALAPNTVASIDGAAIGPSGELVVSFHTVLSGCTAKCALAVYAATEVQAGGGWFLSRRISAKAYGTYIQSQPFVDAHGHAGLAYVAQFAHDFELVAIAQRSPVAGWKLPRTLVTQAVKQGKKHSTLSLVGTETDASGNATIVFASGLTGSSGSTISSADGNIATSTWESPSVLASNAAPNGARFASNSVGGLALAWDNPNAPITVMARTQTGGAWATTGPVGSPNCGTPTAICTTVLGLDIDGTGTQRILFGDASAGQVLFSQSF